MSEPKRMDPCMSLEIQDDGAVLLTVAAQLQPGGCHWTPAEAGLWFARSWQRAEQALATVTFHRALEQGRLHLVTQGDHAWEVMVPPLVGEGPAPQAPVVPAPLAVAPEEEEESVIDLAEDENRLLEVQPAMFNGPESLLAVPAPRIPERAAETGDQRKLVRHLNKAVQPMSVADLCKATDMTVYRVRKALDGLLDRQLIQKETVPSRGRYKEMAVYSGTVRE